MEAEAAVMLSARSADKGASQIPSHHQKVGTRHGRTTEPLEGSTPAHSLASHG